MNHSMDQSNNNTFKQNVTQNINEANYAQEEL